MLPQRDALDVVCVTPLDKEAILVAHDSIVQVVDIHGQATRTRSMKTSSSIKFSFRIEAVGKQHFFLPTWLALLIFRGSLSNLGESRAPHQSLRESLKYRI